jgi:hypothetical protein
MKLQYSYEWETVEPAGVDFPGGRGCIAGKTEVIS